MQVIPSVDLLDGRVVRLHKGKYDEVTVYNTDARAQLLTYLDAGFDRIHVVDLNGAKEGVPRHLSILEALAGQYPVSFQFGGGIRTVADVARAFDAGVTYLVGTSMAVKTPELWAEAVSDFGAARFISGLDLKDGQVAYAGWTETAPFSTGSFIATQSELGIRTFLCTDVSKDGTLSGANDTLYASLHREWPGLDWIASGGFAGPGDLPRLDRAGCTWVVIGKAFYEGRITLEEMKQFNQAQRSR